MSLLDRVSIVLVEPQDALNIGSALRAVTNMGIGNLRLVNPIDADPRRIAITAPGLGPAVAALPTYASLSDALADSVLTLGFTARPRRAPREVYPLHTLGQVLEERLSGDEGRCHLVFGREDFGLSNEDLDRCHGVVTIPTDPGYHSLNLAQAVLLAAYTARRAATEWEGPPKGSGTTEPATAEEVEGLVAQIESTLHFIEFFKFEGARTNVMRTLRVLLARAQLQHREAQTLRGIFGEVVAFARRYRVPEPEER